MLPSRSSVVLPFQYPYALRLTPAEFRTLLSHGISGGWASENDFFLQTRSVETTHGALYQLVRGPLKRPGLLAHKQDSSAEPSDAPAEFHWSSPQERCIRISLLAPGADIFRVAPAPSNRVPTSDAAAAALTATSPQREKLSALRFQVYAYIYRAGEEGVMGWEVERALKLPHETASARINDLFHQHCIRRDGRQGRTPAGRHAYYWVTMPYLRSSSSTPSAAPSSAWSDSGAAR